MEWKQLIADLTAKGVVQTSIAAECGVSQSSISDLARGQTKQPSFELGNKLIALHVARCKAVPLEEGEPIEARA